MELKAHSLFKFIPIAVGLFVFINCSQKQNKEEEASVSSFYIEGTVPGDTVLINNKNLKLDNGIFYLNNVAYSGYIRETYSDKNVKAIGGFLNGMQHGRSVSFFANSKVRDIRMYKQNKSFGKHTGYWENGKMKFQYYYLNDKREGSTKQWYEDGEPYAFLNFKDDREDGLQKAWRQNGKLYINYEAKEGFRYGLQKSNLCYTLVDETFKKVEQ